MCTVQNYKYETLISKSPRQGLYDTIIIKFKFFKMTNLKKLSRIEMKAIGGAGTCALVAHYSDGSAGLIPYTGGMSMSQAQSAQANISSNLDNGEINQYGANRVTYCCDSCKNYNRLSDLY